MQRGKVVCSRREAVSISAAKLLDDAQRHGPVRYPFPGAFGDDPVSVASADRVLVQVMIKDLFALVRRVRDDHHQIVIADPLDVDQCPGRQDFPVDPAPRGGRCADDVPALAGLAGGAGGPGRLGLRQLSGHRPENEVERDSEKELANADFRHDRRDRRDYTAHSPTLQHARPIFSGRTARPTGRAMATT